jgi:uncharacterized protein YndB with AHSA1/START domain
MTASAAALQIEDASSHGSFALEVLLEAPVSEVWQTIVEGERRSRWLRLPGRPGPQTAVDLELGASESLHAQVTIGDTVENMQRDTQVVDLVTGRRLVFLYRAVVDDQPRWASLTTVHLDPRPGHNHGPDLTRLTWTEPYTLLMPTTADNIAHLRGGTRLLLNALAVTLGATPRPATER